MNMRTIFKYCNVDIANLSGILSLETLCSEVECNEVNEVEAASSGNLAIYWANEVQQQTLLHCNSRSRCITCIILDFYLCFLLL